GDQAGAERGATGDGHAAATPLVLAGQFDDPGVHLGRVGGLGLAALESTTQPVTVVGHDFSSTSCSWRSDSSRSVRSAFEAWLRTVAGVQLSRSAMLSSSSCS